MSTILKLPRCHLTVIDNSTTKYMGTGIRIYTIRKIYLDYWPHCSQLNNTCSDKLHTFMQKKIMQSLNNRNVQV